jgi:hypothetical protein
VDHALLNKQTVGTSVHKVIEAQADALADPGGRAAKKKQPAEKSIAAKPRCAVLRDGLSTRDPPKYNFGGVPAQSLLRMSGKEIKAL